MRQTELRRHKEGLRDGDRKKLEMYHERLSLSVSLSHKHTHTERETEKEKAGGEQEGQRKGGERDGTDRTEKEVSWEWPKG